MILGSLFCYIVGLYRRVRVIRTLFLFLVAPLRLLFAEGLKIRELYVIAYLGFDSLYVVITSFPLVFRLIGRDFKITRQRKK